MCSWKGAWLRNGMRGYRKFGLKRCTRLQRKKSWNGAVRSTRVADLSRKTSRGRIPPPPPASLGLMVWPDCWMPQRCALVHLTGWEGKRQLRQSWGLGCDTTRSPCSTDPCTMAVLPSCRQALIGCGGNTWQKSKVKSLYSTIHDLDIKGKDSI